MKVICKYCGKGFSKYGVDNHITFTHTHSRVNIGNTVKGRIPWNKGLTSKTDERIKKMSEAASISMTGKTGIPHREDSKVKISVGMCGNKNATNRVDRQNYYKGVRMDSKWEVGVAMYFDEMGTEWKYSLKGFKLSDGRYYYPDFFIYENEEFKKLVEVKGYFRESNRKKFNLFLNDYPNIVVELWDKIILRELRILNLSGYIMPKYSVDGSGSDCKSDG